MQNFIVNYWEQTTCIVMIIAAVCYIYRLLDKYLLGEIFDMVRNNKDW